MKVGGIAEWSLTSGETQPSATGSYPQHPHHQHINHFQLTNSDAISNGVLFRAGDWRDTVPLYATTPALVRFHIADFIGPMVVHCHSMSLLIASTHFDLVYIGA